MDSTTNTSISLSWTSAGSVVDYEVLWQRDTSGECSDEDEGNTTITDGSTSYDVMGLEEDSNYTVSVMAINSIGNANSDTVTGMTVEAGTKKYTKQGTLCNNHISSYTAPTAAPTSVTTSSGTFSSITVRWDPVNCTERNGDITGYSVRYGVQGSAVGDRTVEMVSGDSSGGMYVISGLSAATMYAVEVAAVNSVETGVYSNPIDQLTLGV